MNCNFTIHITKLVLAPFLLALTFVTMNLAHAETTESKIEAAFNQGKLPNLHSVYATIGEQTISEIYFNGQDESWGQKLGEVNHGPNTLHDLRSVTKSIIGLLYGIALAEGKVPSPNEPLLDQFSQYSDLKDGSGRENILIEHALTMKMGTEWNENLPYTSAKNSEIAMELAKDRYRFILDRPMVSKPGEKWTYSGGAVAIIAKLIADGTNMSIDAYANEKLFAPLGISNYEWAKGADGEPSAASGLRLSARDLSKIGEMISKNGKFENRQIVSSEWLHQSFQRKTELEPGFYYGYLWYLAGSKDKQIIIGLGNGGQRFTIQPAYNFVAVTFAGGYNHPNAWKVSYKVLTDFILPAAKKHLAK
jgi:CubicO group peptidase (beta-lactamase class C family)